MPKKTITCKLTGNIGPAVDAHIIPRAFYNLYDETGEFREGGTVVTLEEGKYCESTRRIGVYDQKIVTKEGENLFKACDDYAAKFFLQDFSRKPWKPSSYNPRVSTLAPDQFDSNLIRRFCMTVLWRAHATDQQFFGNVDLGHHEERLRELILNDEVGDPRDFSVILSGWSNISHPNWPVMAPGKLEVRGLEFFRFKTSGIVFNIKADSRPFPEEGMAAVVGGIPELAVYQREYFPSEEEEELYRKIGKRNEAR